MAVETVLLLTAAALLALLPLLVRSVRPPGGAAPADRSTSGSAAAVPVLGDISARDRRDIQAMLRAAEAEESAAIRARAYAYLTSLASRHVRVDEVVPGTARGGDRLVFDDGTTVTLSPGGSAQVRELAAAIRSCGPLPLAAIDGGGRDYTVTLVVGARLVRLRAARATVS